MFEEDTIEHMHGFHSVCMYVCVRFGCDVIVCLDVLSRCMLCFYIREVISEFISGCFGSCLFLVHALSLSLMCSDTLNVLCLLDVCLFEDFVDDSCVHSVWVKFECSVNSALNYMHMCRICGLNSRSRGQVVVALPPRRKLANHNTGKFWMKPH